MFVQIENEGEENEENRNELNLPEKKRKYIYYVLLS